MDSLPDILFNCVACSWGLIVDHPAGLLSLGFLEASCLAGPTQQRGFNPKVGCLPLGLFNIEGVAWAGRAERIGREGTVEAEARVSRCEYVAL